MCRLQRQQARELSGAVNSSMFTAVAPHLLPPLPLACSSNSQH
jgi:hypothetical protein